MAIIDNEQVKSLEYSKLLVKQIADAMTNIASAAASVKSVIDQMNSSLSTSVKFNQTLLDQARARLGVRRDELELQLKTLRNESEAIQNSSDWKRSVAAVEQEIAQVNSSLGNLDRAGYASFGAAPTAATTIINQTTSDSTGEEQVYYLSNIYQLLSEYLPSLNYHSQRSDDDLDNLGSVSNNQDLVLRLAANSGSNATGLSEITSFIAESNNRVMTNTSALINTASSEIIQKYDSELASFSQPQEITINNNYEAPTQNGGGGGGGNLPPVGSLSSSGYFGGNGTENILQTFANKSLSVDYGIFNFIKSIAKGVSNLGTTISDGVIKQVEDVTTILTESQSISDTHLYGLMTKVDGLNVNFVDLGNDAIALVSETRSMSMINEKKLITNMATLISQGITFNIEQKALWATMTDKIVSTFEVTNDTLLRTVKLQQQELTDTYMGMEAALTRTMNSMFKDNQYFASNEYDTVWQNLQDVLAKTSASVGAEIMYQIQLWLGSLSSLGLSGTATNSISSAINALLTGNIDQLGDRGRTLMAMAASNSGLSLTDLLTGGVSSGKEMSSLMNGIITVLQDIYSQSKDNNVLLSEWGDILDLSISDWKSISNLQSSQISQLLSLATYTQQDALEELSYIEDTLVSERTLIAERSKNLAENTMFEAGWNFATDEGSYILWDVGNKLTTFLNNLSGTGDQNTFLSGIAELANYAATITSTLNTISSFAAIWDPLSDAIATVSSGNVIGDQKYGQFNNTFVNGNVGDFSSELFSYLVNAKGYIDYSNILKQSYDETRSLWQIISTSTGSGNKNGVITTSGSANAATSAGTVVVNGNTGASGSLTASGPGVVITQGTASGQTVGNSAANPSNSATTYTIATIYQLLSTSPGIYVTLAKVEQDAFNNVAFNKAVFPSFNVNCNCGGGSGGGSSFTPPNSGSIPTQ